MYIQMRLQFIIALFIVISIVACTDEDTFITDISDLEDFEMDDSTYWNGSDGSGRFVDGNKVYHNTYYSDWDTWSGFAYSNLLNTYYLDSESMYAVYADGGADKSRNFAVAHQFEKIIITFNDENGEEPRSVQLTNTTYTALSIKFGYGSAKKFGGRGGDDPDWFKLTITGIGLVDQINGQIDFFLADYRFEDNSNDYVIYEWRKIDLSGLGVVKRLEFELSSSDAGTPLYFCLDNLKGRIHY